MQKIKTYILRINLTKEVLNLYAQNDKMLVKDINEDRNTWRDISYSWTEKPNTVKIPVFL